MSRFLLAFVAGCLTLAIVTASAGHAQAVPQPPSPSQSDSPLEQSRAVLNRYCVTCHNQRAKIGGLTLDNLDLTAIAEHAETWEKVVRKLRGGVMPPPGRPRPERVTADSFRQWLEGELDRAAAANLNPGRPAAFHRLNRTEYRNAVRDLLALDVGVESWLPADPASYGFDNIGDALGVSSAQLERYLSVAQRISALAVGNPAVDPGLQTYVLPSDLTQRDRMDGLPFGTRGGTLVHHYFPVDGEYDFQIRLGRNYNTRINGLTEKHQIELAIDGERRELVTIGGKPRVRGGGGDDYAAPVDEDDALKFRLPVKAGRRSVAVAFIKRPAAQFEDLFQPILRDAPEYGDTQGMPSLSKIEIDGPHNPAVPAESAARRRIFVCHPSGAADELQCATRIMSTLARRAYRRPVTEADVELLLRFYKEGRSAGGFERGIEAALARMLVSPSFLFRVEQDPDSVKPGTAYRVSDLDLASRLSFFLWSSIPDDELLGLAEKGRLKDATVLDQQVRRMLADQRSNALVSNFAGQWLHLRDVPESKPDRWLFPDFNDNLRLAFRKETELFIESILREDRSALDLLRANYTFVNERLARHYGIPNVYGSHFRRVNLSDEVRGGLLGQGSILMVTSQDIRTSPVRRGVYVLENLLGVPPPPPPADVPPLKDTTPAGQVLSMRERMVQHRKNPVCASCHSVMDPIGLALENFDAVGAWRTMGESKTPIDASGALPDGTAFDGPAGLKKALLTRSDGFIATLTEKLLIYALGRGLESYDAPAVRRIMQDAAKDDYRLSALIRAIVRSVPFQMRRSLDRPVTTVAEAVR
jgi:mono/diheme cytochrome c family protein